MTKGLGSMLEVARIQSEINRLFEQPAGFWTPAPKESGSWIPMADIVESDDALVVTVELPGVAANDSSFRTHGGDVILTGEKVRPQVGGPGRSHVAERAYGRFRRVIDLGVPVNTTKPKRCWPTVTLRIRLPEGPEPARRRSDDSR